MQMQGYTDDIGAYDNEEDAARTYDLAALKYWGPGPASILNFPVERYRREVEEMEKMSTTIMVGGRLGLGAFAETSISIWEPTWNFNYEAIEFLKVFDFYCSPSLGTQEEAAAAYDRAAIEFRGPNAVTNFDISNYANKLKKIPSEVDVRVEHDDIQVKQETLSQVQEHDHQEDRTQWFNQVISLKEHEHPWDLCLDIGFNSLPIPDIPLEKSSSEVFGLLDDKGFEDDIEFIFDGQFGDREFLQDGYLAQENARRRRMLCGSGCVEFSFFVAIALEGGANKLNYDGVVFAQTREIRIGMVACEDDG
ncbi:hypothetical protein BUALT_BualtUnG0017400 [Buddleja alternifolia]|uniref:AP2/ERF domain-containing protein n=1 Tax=Buddleja alternifolia TaxID=168488 RepID=A0AAV6W1E1_9LAMI|nr:hypothetical protein BUALT_BualtUnG0017400 [Buddleja alternifolia]